MPRTYTLDGHDLTPETIDKLLQTEKNYRYSYKKRTQAYEDDMQQECLKKMDAVDALLNLDQLERWDLNQMYKIEAWEKTEKCKDYYYVHAIMQFCGQVLKHKREACPIGPLRLWVEQSKPVTSQDLGPWGPSCSQAEFDRATKKWCKSLKSRESPWKFFQARAPL